MIVSVDEKTSVFFLFCCSICVKTGDEMGSEGLCLCTIPFKSDSLPVVFTGFSSRFGNTVNYSNLMFCGEILRSCSCLCSVLHS